MHKLNRDDAGFTLIELLLVIVIIGIVTVPMGNLLIGFLKNTDSTTARYTESHDGQISAAYFSGDVASMGARNWSDTTTPYAFNQSVELNAPATSGLYPCGTAGLPNAVVRIGWDDFTSGAGATSTLTRVAYVVETANGESQLHRLSCAGSATSTSDLVLAHYVVSAGVACSPACSGSGSSLPQTVTLTLTVHDARSTSANYVVVLSGQRRQT